MLHIQPGIYEHYKGGRYHVFGVGKHSETLEEFVIYEALYDNPESKLWVRPLKEFTEEIIWSDGIKKPRYLFIQNNKTL